MKASDSMNYVFMNGRPFVYFLSLNKLFVYKLLVFTTH